MAAVLAAGTLLPATSFAAPQTFNSALPLSKGQFVWREQFFLRQASAGTAGSDRELRVTGLAAVLGYGVSADWAVFGVVPWQRKEFDVGPIGRFGSGFGDASVFVRYTLFKQNAAGRTFRIAPFAGFKAPTGKTGETDSRGRLPRALQPGTGAWDGFGGVVATWQTLDWEFDAQIRYQRTGSDDDFEVGNRFDFDASWQYRIWPRELGSGIEGFGYAVLESNLQVQDNNRVNGLQDTDSGGTRWFLSPGLQWVTRRWVAEAIVQLPVTQDLDGNQPDDDFIVRAGFRISF
ncbi:MAG: transporter [Wenzhouxiangellaceae bacterium]